MSTVIDKNSNPVLDQALDGFEKQPFDVRYVDTSYRFVYVIHSLEAHIPSNCIFSF